MKQIVDFEVRDGNVYGSTSNTEREGKSIDDLYAFMTGAAIPG